MRLLTAMLALTLAACATFRRPTFDEPWWSCLPSLQTIRFLQRFAAPVGPDDVPTETQAIPNPTGAAFSADVYRAEGTPLGAMLIVPGAAETGKADPRLRHLARTMAKSNIQVMVPEIPMLQALQVRSEISEAVRLAFLYLIRQPDMAPRGRAAILAISFSVGPALMAALQPDVGSKLDLLFGLGGYYAVEPLLTFLTTGWFQDEHGQWQHREPNRYGQWVYVLSNLDTLADIRDRQVLQEMARRRIADNQADIAALVGQLGPEGQALYELISNDDPNWVSALIARLPAEARVRLQGLDLARLDFSGLTAPVILLHGRNDDVIPYVGSIALYRALPAGRSKLFLVTGLDHIDVHGVAGLACAVEAIFQSLAAARRMETTVK